MQSSLVYNYRCVRCTSEYVGSTVAEHCGRSSRTGYLLSSPLHSSIHNHANICAATISLDNCKVIGTSTNIGDLKILENSQIFKRKLKLNDLNRSAAPLSIVNK